MPKPVKQTVEETVDTTATDATTDAENGSQDAADASQETKERAAAQPWSLVQQKLLTKTMRQMRKGEIPGGVTPASVARHLATLPEFAGMDIKPVKISSTAATLRKQRAKYIEEGKLPATAPEVPEFDRQHSEKLAPEDFAAMLED